MNEKTPKILNDFLIYMTTIRGKSKGTRQEYKYNLVLLFKFLKCMYDDISTEDMSDIKLDNITIEFIKDITLEDLYMFLEYCEEKRKNSAVSRARKVASMKSFFNYLVNKRKLLDYNPTSELESPKIGKRNPIYLNLEETKQFLTGIKENKHQKRNYCIIMIFLNCGLRISELCGINIVDIKNDLLTVLGKGNKERTVYLNDVCLKAINDYILNERCLVENIKDSEALFISQKGTRLGKRAIEKMIKATTINSGINNDKITPHKLRHTAATLLYKANPNLIALQQILGHESVATTQIYTHVSNEDLKIHMSKNPLNDL